MEVVGRQGWLWLVHPGGNGRDGSVLRKNMVLVWHSRAPEEMGYPRASVQCAAGLW